MNLDQLIMFCTLRGNIETHEKLENISKRDSADVWCIRLGQPGRTISFWYKKGNDNEVTFVSGRVLDRRQDSDFGLHSYSIVDVEHLSRLVQECRS